MVRHLTFWLYESVPLKTEKIFF